MKLNALGLGAQNRPEVTLFAEAVNLAPAPAPEVAISVARSQACQCASPPWGSSNRARLQQS